MLLKAKSISEPFLRGAGLGSMFAFIYITLYLVPIVLSSLSQDPFSQTLTIIFFFYMFGIVFGVLPAAIIGGFTAFIIARFLKSRRKGLNRRKAMLVGGTVSVAGTILLSILYVLVTGFEGISGFLLGYLFYIGFPSVLYICGGVWIGNLFYRELERMA